MLFSLLVATAFAQTVTNGGYTPADASCVTMKSVLCADATCQQLDIGIANTVLAALGDATGSPTPLPGIDSGMQIASMNNFLVAPVWAAVGFMVTYNGTGGALTRIHPALEAVYKCDVEALGLVWPDYSNAWAALDACMNDAACMSAYDNIRKDATDKPTIKKSAPQYEPVAELNGLRVPWPVDNDNDAYCNIVFAALAEGNAKVLMFILSFATAYIPYDPEAPMNPDAIVAHCQDKMNGMVVALGAIVGTSCFVGGLLFACFGCWCYNHHRANKNNNI